MYPLINSISMTSKTRFLVSHLSISALAAAFLSVIIFLVWYPYPLAFGTGAISIFLIVLIVDVILGPFLAFLIYKEGKKSLKLDLSIVILIQCTAFSYGAYILALGRPVWIVFNVDRFDLVLAHELDPLHRKNAVEEYKTLGWFGPKWVASVAPTDAEVKNDLVFDSLFNGVDLPQRPDLYISYYQVTKNISARSIPLDDLKKYNNPSEVDVILESNSKADAYLPLVARKQHMAVLINKASGEVVKVVLLNPW